MNIFIALLRAVNVGGTGKLSMKDLKRLCEQAGFANVQTYIASGNVIFKSKKSEAQVKAALESQIGKHLGKPITVVVRTPTELAEILAKNPFPDAATNRTVAIFLDTSPPHNTLDEICGRKDEQIRLGKREIYVHYGDGMAHSKLKIPAAKTGTARNLNTVRKLTELATKL